jgi:sugar diacid utilization regulator
VAGWLKPTALGDPDARPPRGVEPALELFALQLVEGREEMWHVAFIQDDMLLVSTEEHGAGDHQRRLREVGIRLQQQARRLAGPGWAYTLGLGTPQLGATGLRQSAAEARIAADSAVAAGRPGGVELTDVTGLRRVLLDFYASPISRSLLHDVLAPLDALGPERATTSVRTLLAYLAHRNSLASAGRELNLHPNAVGYRLKRIREVLQLDLDDPDVRFSVELACRVRLLGASRR